LTAECSFVLWKVGKLCLPLGATTMIDRRAIDYETIKVGHFYQVPSNNLFSVDRVHIILYYIIIYLSRGRFEIPLQSVTGFVSTDKFQYISTY
jgi:hypothetical protein